jgi:hypothetical protein
MNWIPVSHKSPYSTGEVLVTFQLGHNAYLVDIMIYKKEKRMFIWSRANQRDMTDNVIAWMPLPQPYKN